LREEWSAFFLVGGLGAEPPIYKLKSDQIVGWFNGQKRAVRKDRFA